MSHAYRLHLPPTSTTGVVFASPHSGRAYSQAFLDRARLDSHTIRSSEDAFIDEVFAAAPTHGAPLLAACTPRAFVDLNRADSELDPAVIEGVERGPHNPRINAGLGVIPRVVAQGRPIYDGKLTRAEAEARLADHWHPYHRRLRALLEEAQTFGPVLLVDCHSTPREALAPGPSRPDVVLGDRFGAACGREVMARVEDAFRDAGLRTSRNTPFSGAYVTQAYGRPSRGQHAVQIEIDRSLYMDEARIEKRADFDAFATLIAKVIASLCEIGRDAVPLAAE